MISGGKLIREVPEMREEKNLKNDAMSKTGIVTSVGRV